MLSKALRKDSRNQDYRQRIREARGPWKGDFLLEGKRQDKSDGGSGRTFLSEILIRFRNGESLQTKWRQS